MPLGLIGLGALAKSSGFLGKLTEDPQAKARAQIMKLLQSQGGRANEIYQQLLASPAFSQAQRNIAGGANAMAGNLAASLGARGLGETGVGAVTSSMIPSIVGGQQAQLATDTYSMAQKQAMEKIQRMIETIMATAGPNQTQQLFGQLMGWLGNMGTQAAQAYASGGAGGK